MKDRIKNVTDQLLLNSNQFLDFKNPTRDRMRIDALMLESGRAEANERQVCRKELKTIGSCRLGHRCPYIHPVADRGGTIPQHLIQIHLPNCQFQTRQHDRFFIKLIKYQSKQNGFIYRIVGFFTHSFWKNRKYNLENLAEFDKKYSINYKIEEGIMNLYPIGEDQYAFRDRAPSLMELVVVKLENGDFKRGRVTRMVGNDCRIFCVDTGEAVNAPLKRVLQLHQDLLRFPAQARFCQMAKMVEPIVGTRDEASVLFTRDHQRLIDQQTAYYQLASVKKPQLMDRFNFPVVDMHIFPFLPTTKRKVYALAPHRGKVLFREIVEERIEEEDDGKVTHFDLSSIGSSSGPKSGSGKMSEIGKSGINVEDFEYGHDPIAAIGLRYVGDAETPQTETGTTTS
ncbi:unnamed protein product [Oikopleura dioica]|uniref:C3H1-type domain-containing protein n=1 Tax=Oikopleura dioica TaxID=34765 RepID=E4Y9L8_OIKDI|nr:unnamed protein product [Oikopleura dioica]